MDKKGLNPRLRLIQQANLKDRVVLVRVDHNVVKKGLIKDPYRIDVSFKTLYAIAEKGGRPVLMTHVGRPRDKQSGHISCREGDSVQPVVDYLKAKLPIEILVPEFPIDPDRGITKQEGAMEAAIEALKGGKQGMIYLPNIRWFEGEETKGPERDAFAAWLAGLADVYVNDAFSSWRAHGSTYDVANHLPSYAGFQLQEELLNLHRILEPPRPFLGIIAGAKLDTKIGPLSALYSLVDHVILGGLLYNVFLAAKYDLMFKGVSEEDKALAMPLVELDAKEKKILEMPFIVESETMEGKSDGRYRTISVADFKPGDAFQYILDVDPRSYDEAGISETVKASKSIFVNAVMGLTPPFSEGTRSLYRLIGENGGAHKMFAGGDTLQELRTLCPGQYMAGEAGTDYYYFTGGGSVLTAIETGDPYGMKPIQVLMD